jgi:signal transduction histidine kinase
VETPSAESGTIRVLLVDDDADDFALIKDLLADAISLKFTLDWISDYEQGLVSICSGCYDAVLLDFRLGAKTGLELLTEARRLGCEAPVVILTGLSDNEIDLAVMQGGADYYLEKSRLDAVLLERTIRYAIQQRELEVELEQRVRQRTEELDRANEALQLASRRKDEFIATLAHELRNPLAPIRNALEILRLSGDAPEAVASARALLQRQVGQLTRLIDDLLDVSRITRGKLRLNPERLAFSDVLDAALEQSRPLLDKSLQRLSVEVPEEPIYITGDRVRLAQVFTNILNNAAKYSDPGGQVTLTAKKINDRLMISIRDTGIGISPKVLEHIFDPFTQVEGNPQRTQGGLGIGLNLVRSLVEMHDGKIEARSEGPGRGSEFSVILPCEPKS